MEKSSLQPLTNSARSFFRAEAEAVPEIVHRPPPDIGPEDRNTCRWCFEKFDVALQERSIRERGYLRTNLKMADNGTELVCCDNCWQAAIGARTLMNGVLVPCDDPNQIPNPLLRTVAVPAPE